MAPLVDEGGRDIGVIFRCYPGDGEYRDSDGYRYTVDTGTIAVFPAGMLRIRYPDTLPVDQLGRLVCFDEPFECRRLRDSALVGGIEIYLAA